MPVGFVSIREKLRSQIFNSHHAKKFRVTHKDVELRFSFDLKDYYFLLSRQLDYLVPRLNPEKENPVFVLTRTFSTFVQPIFLQVVYGLKLKLAYKDY